MKIKAVPNIICVIYKQAGDYTVEDRYMIKCFMLEGV